MHFLSSNQLITLLRTRHSDRGHLDIVQAALPVFFVSRPAGAFAELHLGLVANGVINVTRNRDVCCESERRNEELTSLEKLAFVQRGRLLVSY